MRIKWGFVPAVLSIALLLSSCGGGGGGDSDSEKGTLTIQGQGVAPLARQAVFYGATGAEFGSPTSFNIDLYKIYISENEDCSNPVLITSEDTPLPVDILSDPTLFSGDVPAGTYKCVIFKANDIFTFTPDAAAQENWGLNGLEQPICGVNNSYDFDILKVEDVPEEWFNPETSTWTTGAGSQSEPVSQVIFLFATTNIDALSSDVHPNQSTTLATSFTVAESGDTYLVFKVDVNNTIRPYGDYCWVEGFNAWFEVAE